MRKKTGQIEVICGCMFSGKTEELIRRLRRAKIAQQKFQAFKPEWDTRYSSDKLASHNGLFLDAIVVRNPKEILELIEADTQVVAIDDAQFFDRDIIDVCRNLAERGKRVIVAGLDMDFRAEPFGCMPFLIAIAEEVTKLQAICIDCGEEASFSQRFINNKLAPYDDSTIVVGASDFYKARCREHYVKPIKPEKK